jgi:hypothetical protein
MVFFIFQKHNTTTDTTTYMSTHLYKYSHIQHIFMGTSERLSRLDLEI